MPPVSFHNGGFCGHLYDFLSRRYFHVDIEDDGLANADNDFPKDFRLEAGQLYGYAVSGWRETTQLVLPVLVGHGSSSNSLFCFLRHNGDLWNKSAGGIRYRPAD